MCVEGGGSGGGGRTVTNNVCVWGGGGGGRRIEGAKVDFAGTQSLPIMVSGMNL